MYLIETLFLAIAIRSRMLLVAIFTLIGSQIYGQNQYNLNVLNRVFDVTTKIASDSIGCMWLSDQDGIYRYDGYDFKLLPYKQIFGKKFKNKSVSLFQKDKSGNFWLATENGELVRMSPQGRILDYTAQIQKTALRKAVSKKDQVFFGGADGTIWLYDISKDKINKLFTLPIVKEKSKVVLDMVLSEKNMLYISTLEGEIYTYNIEARVLKTLKLPIAQTAQEMFFMVIDQRSRLWVSTEFQGLFCYDPMTKDVQRYGERSRDNNEYMMYRSIYCDRDGVIWLGTDGHGLRRLDPKSGKITSFEHELGNSFSLSNNTVRYINGDDNGNIWVIVKGGKVNILSMNNYPILGYTGLPNNIPHRILSILKDKHNYVWIGSDGEGLSRISPHGERNHVGRKGQESSSFRGRFVQALAEDKEGNVWVGTYLNGLYRYDRKKAVFNEIPVGKMLGMPLLKDFRNVYIDRKNRIWSSSTYGIHVLDSTGELLASYAYGSRGTTGVIADAFLEDKNGQLWVAFSKGILTKFRENPKDLRQSTFEQVNYHQWNNKAARYYGISQMLEDKKGNFWLRCEGGFLIYFDPNNQSYQSFEEDELLKGIDVMAVAQDTDGKLWISSRNGIHNYDPQEKRIFTYTRNDGLQDNNYIRKSIYQALDGQLFFGGNNGLSAFYPKGLNHTPSIARLTINGIQVLNKPMEEVLTDLPQDRFNLHTLRLDAQQSSFSINFSAIGNLINTNYKYQYRLKGFDKDFTEPSEQRTATYTNIPSGHYIFEVQAAQQGGDVFDIGPIKLDVYIAPYWWQSMPAKIVYFLIVLVLFYAIWRWLMMRTRLHQEEIVRMQEKELYQLKVNFFAKISHEIQTPLSLIIGPLESLFSRKINESTSPIETRQFQLIKNNAERLSRIVSELTQVRDKEIGKLNLKREDADFSAHLRRIALSFEELAQRKGILFNVKLESAEVISNYDYLKIEHVIYNLLGNAIKFTPPGGTVELTQRLSQDGKVWSVQVKDTGPGMDALTARNVFQFFYQGEVGKKVGTGLGIGLALSKEIVLLHNGEMNLYTALNQGSCFDFTLPIVKWEKEFDGDLEMFQPKKSEWPSISLKVGGKEFSILVVEDNLDMQSFLRDLLADYFEVRTVDNGKEALLALMDRHYDLVLSDIMMPELDGLQLAEQLYVNSSFRHIPVILLTAYPSESNKQKGFGAGIISYLSKPFHPEELLLLIQNILLKQQHAIHQYRDKMTSMPVIEEGKMAKADQFLRRLTESLKDKVSDPDFLLEDLEKILHMSYSVIFKKCQEITGLTPSEYFRKIRLKKAAILLVAYDSPVAEAAFEVGFTDSKYFSRLFKECFGMTPSAFKAQVSKEQLEDFLQKY